MIRGGTCMSTARYETHSPLRDATPYPSVFYRVMWKNWKTIEGIFFKNTSFPNCKSYSDVRKHISDTSRHSRRVQNTILISKTYFEDENTIFWIFLDFGSGRGGGSSITNLSCGSPRPKIPKMSGNTFLISKSYSEHVSSVEKCRRCVFEHKKTFLQFGNNIFLKKNFPIVLYDPL